MATFNLDTFMAAGGAGGGLGAISTAFGVPSCLLSSALPLALIPTPILAAIAAALLAGVELADAVIKAFYAFLRDLFGIIEWLTEEGLYQFMSLFSKFGLDQGFGALIAAIGALTAAAGAVGSLYANYQAIAGQIASMRECLNSFSNYLKHKHQVAGEIPQDPTAFNDFVNENFAIQKLQVESALNFIDDANTQIKNINEIIAARNSDPSLEPKFNPEACSYLSGTIFADSCIQQQEPEKEIFRLVFGPPKSTFGQFILSNDGLYFDSQTSGIVPALTYLNRKQATISLGDRWRFNQDPNLGGRGKGLSTNELKDYVNTILDPSILDERPDIQIYYDKDGFLQELIGNRNKRIYDMSAQLGALETDEAPTSVILNFKQSIISENVLFTEKINKRKKQIELAIRLPSIYGSDVNYMPGEVPVNDFSYLGGLNISVDVQKQRELSFSQVDIAGVVSPINVNTTYVIPKVHNKNSSLEHLIIAEDGAGAIIYDGSSVSSTDGLILQAENSLTTDGLFAMYNFLDTNIEDPSSTSFTSRNSASITDQYYAQLVAQSQTYTYSKGLGIPYLHGITVHSQDYPTAPSTVGSFVRLPNAKPFNDLLYNPNGTTLDFWVHVPKLTSITEGYDINGVSSLYRLVLANENVGFKGDGSSTNTEFLQNQLGTNAVRGFIMGFTRDRRLVGELPASNETDDNPATDSVFFIAPTQSANASSAGLINRSYFDNDECAGLLTKYHCMTHSVSDITNGVSFKDCEDKFCHVAVSFNPMDDKISFYLDGNLMTTSSMSYVFGIAPHSMPNLPTVFVPENSFEYSTNNVGPYASNDLKYGPKLDRLGISQFNRGFTPWIVGGGYTDGMYQNGNFMGGTYGGIISGLRGHLGSFKLYSKPLSDSEILNNYKTQKDFFKNIDTFVLGWEPILSI